LRVPTQIVAEFDETISSPSCERLDHHDLVAVRERHVEIHAIRHHSCVDENRHMLAHASLLVKDVIPHRRRSIERLRKRLAQRTRIHVLRRASDVTRQCGGVFDVGH
jgi:hypothetical protein